MEKRIGIWYRFNNKDLTINYRQLLEIQMDIVEYMMDLASGKRLHSYWKWSI